jgi:hypothetical protein
MNDFARTFLHALVFFVCLILIADVRIATG